MLAFLLCIGFELINWSYQRDEVNDMAKQNAEELAQGFKQLLALKSDPFKKQALDYAAWNDLANFTEHKEPTWAKDNLDGSIIQFGINAFYVLDQAKNILFKEANKPFLEELPTMFPLALLDTSSARLLHFYAKTPQSIVEFYVAPIHRIDEDVSKDSLAKGFVIIAKHWDEAFLKELSSFGIAEAYLNLPNGNHNEYKITHEIPLLGIQGEKVGVLYLHLRNRMSEVLDNYGAKDIQLSLLEILFLMGILALLIAKFLSFPLRDITHALNNRSKEPLRKYLLKEDEYGAIATAVCESFDNKEELEYLNANLEKKVQEEVENSRLKDRMLFQQAKLAALGEMLNNIAHQWRQPLNTISVVISKIYLDSKTDKLTPQMLEDEIKKLRELIQHMSSTIDDFKDFFKPDKEKVLFPLYKSIEESIRISDGGIANKDIVFHVDCPSGIVMNSFKKELSHVLLVLINNAKDAIIQKEIEHGTITIKAYAQEYYIIIEVSDNGGGVTDEQLPHIFDPFFTTKEPTGGNGTGLYTSKQIIEQSMQGSISATNEHGGLVVTIVLPRTNEV
jgi:signal transduction histidine kinase